MGYSIIFETYIVKLPDGRIIHFDRSGCNNDDSGRKQDEFTGKIYSVNDFIKYAENFKVDSKPKKEADYFDMRIGNRYVTFYDYGEYLLRKLKRAENLDDFLRSTHFNARYCKAIEVLSPEHKDMTLEEFNDYYYHSPNNVYISWRRIMEFPKGTDEIIRCIEDGKPMEFYIRRIK